MTQKTPSFLKLFTVFFKIGAVAFGGGYAMLPILRHELCSKRKWLTHSSFADTVTIAQTIPGPVAINTVGLVSYKLKGFAGLIFGLTGVIMPAFFIILIFSAFLYTFSDNEIVKSAFIAVRASVAALVFSVFISMAGELKKNILSFAILILSFIFIVAFNIEPALILLSSIVMGIISFLIYKLREKND